MKIIRGTTVKIISLMFLSTVVYSSAQAAFWNKSGNGNLEHRQYSLPKFKEVEVSGSFDLVVKSGPQEVELTVDSNLFDAIELNVKDEKLVVDSSWRIKPTSRPRLILSMEKLESLNASGSVFTTASLNGVTGSLLLKMTGSSTADLKDLSLTKLDIDTSGSTMLTGSGKVSEFKVSSMGSLNVEFEELKILNAHLNVSGESKLKFGSVRTITGKVSGSNSITYLYPPTTSEIKRN
jgi:hypothetical protein